MRLVTGFLLILGYAVSGYAELSKTNVPQVAIDLNPVNPAYCELYDYPRYNTIHDITYMGEDAEQAVFEFKFQSGSCSNKVYTRENLDAGMFYVDIFEPVKFSASQVDPVTVLIQLRIKKVKFFKKGDTREFAMGIKKGGAFGNETSQWRVVGHITPENTTQLQLIRTSL